MVRLLAATVALSILSCPCHADVGHSSYVFDKLYIFSVSDDTMEKTPAWKPDAENPPLPAGKAIKLANEMKDLLVKDTKTHQWKFKQLTLEPARGERWYWVAKYEAVYQGVFSGVPVSLEIIVLMDGTAVKPVIVDDPKRRSP